MPEGKAVWARLKKKLGKDYRLVLTVAAGILGMVLILSSQFSGTSRKAVAADTPMQEELTMEEYATQLEERLAELITQMDGVGRAQVMVTLENGGEYIYAQEEKRTTDRTTDPGGGEGDGRTVVKENVEQKYIIVDKEALVKTQLQPKIQGVVIACEGADNIRVEQQLTNVVTTALGIPSNRVCVVKIQ